MQKGKTSYKKNSYNLKEVSIRLGMSPGWINKVQNLTGGLPIPTGEFGIPKEFSEDDVNMLRVFKILRFLGCDIGNVHSIDKKELLRKFSLLFGDLIFFENNWERTLTYLKSQV